MVGPINQPAKRPHSPSHERHVGSIESRKDNVQLIPNIPTWKPPPPYPHVSYQYTYLPPPYVPDQMWGLPPYPYGMPEFPIWGTLNFCIDRLAPPVQD
jgi:hypothetical protein